MDLRDAVSLVTGSSRGVGRATALALAKEGSHVVVNYYQNEAKANEVVMEIMKMGRRAIAIRADVGVRRDVNEMVSLTLKEFGTIDVLVNNATVPPLRKGIMELSLEEWGRTMAVDFTGVFNCVQEVLKSMIPRKRGRIVNISTVGARWGAYLSIDYASAKAGVIGFTRTLARQLAPLGITVNCVAPGVIDTELVDEEFKRSMVARTPLGRMGMPEEVASAVIFLISNDFVTGETLNVNGGSLMN